MNDLTQEPLLLHEPRLWQDAHWTAKVVKNEDDDGWAEYKVQAGFQLNRQTAQAWVDADFARPGHSRSSD